MFADPEVRDSYRAEEVQKGVIDPYGDDYHNDDVDTANILRCTLRQYLESQIGEDDLDQFSLVYHIQQMYTIPIILLVSHFLDPGESIDFQFTLLEGKIPSKSDTQCH